MLRILLFGKLKDVAGSAEIVSEDAEDIETLKRRLFEQYPMLKDEDFLIAVNQEVVHENVRLKDGDEIALLPPVSGG